MVAVVVELNEIAPPLALPAIEVTTALLLKVQPVKFTIGFCPK